MKYSLFLFALMVAAGSAYARPIAPIVACIKAPCPEATLPQGNQPTEVAPTE